LNSVLARFLMNVTVTVVEFRPVMLTCPCNRAAGVLKEFVGSLTSAETSHWVMVAALPCGSAMANESLIVQGSPAVPVALPPAPEMLGLIFTLVKNVRWSLLKPLAKPSHVPTLVTMGDVLGPMAR
jgi:hypothetical protein